MLWLSTIHMHTIVSYDIHNVLYECRGCLIYTTQSVVKSWCMLVAHDSHKQKSYRLNRPLERVDCNNTN